MTKHSLVAQENTISFPFTFFLLLSEIKTYFKNIFDEIFLNTTYLYYETALFFLMLIDNIFHNAL